MGSLSGGFLGALMALAALVSSVTGAVPAAALPPGDPSLTIATYEGGTETSTSIAVQLLLVWPAGAEQVSVTNGDGAVTTYPVADSLGWQLLPVPQSSPAETRTVSVTFTGPGLSPVSLSDSILLDSAPPRLPVQRLYQNGKGWFLGATVEDRGTGVRSIALLGSSGQPITGVDVCALTLCAPTATEGFFLKRARPRYARITDAAGNTKAVRLVRRETSCSIKKASFPVFTLDDGYYDCVHEGDRCRPQDGHFWNRSAYVRCRKVDGHDRVVLR